jgi:tryptophan synthase alpha chain
LVKKNRIYITKKDIEMSFIKDHITKINSKGEKALAVFLSAGFPDKESFVGLACDVLDAGADILEIGFPFSDPLADGPVIQASSYSSLLKGVDIPYAFCAAKEIKKRTGKPIILMGYANPVNSYGTERFFTEAAASGVEGVIIPDIPLEEYDGFFPQNKETDVILLATPATPEERVKQIDEKSSGFLYCVSVSGTTGARGVFSAETINSVKRMYSVVKNNKMLVGFGISDAENVRQLSPYCDGVIVGSAIIKKLMNPEKLQGISDALSLVKELKAACG